MLRSIIRGVVGLSVAVAIGLSGCGGGGGGGGGDDGGGSDTPTTVQADVSGDWNVTENITSSCPDDARYNQYGIKVTQSGAKLTVLVSGLSFAGTIDGNTIGWKGSYPQDGGTTTINTMTLTLAGDGNSINGTDAWSWVSGNGAEKCSGTTQIAVRRVSTADTVAPSVPTGLTATATSSAQVQLAWAAATDNVGVTGYKVYRDNVFLKAATDISSVDSGLTAGSRHCYQVSAADAANNESARTAQQCVTTPLVADTTAPSAPAGLTLTVTSTSVGLAWTASTDAVGVTGYRIYRDSVLLTTVTGTSASDPGRTPGTQVCYEVSAVDAAKNESVHSTRQCVTPPVPGDTAAPGVPGTPTLTATASEIDLNWTAATDNVGVVGYKIYRGGALIKTATTLTIADSGLVAGTQYCYQLSAVDAAGNESARTTEQCARTLAAGPVLTAPSDSTGAVALSWTFTWPLLSSNQEGYVLQESKVSPDVGFLTILTTSGTGVADRQSPRTYTLTRTPGTYFYRVRARVGGTTDTDWSNVATVTVTEPSSVTFAVVPTNDNTLIYSTADSSQQNKVYAGGDISVGCNWAAGTFQNDWVCAAMALRFDVQSRIAGKTVLSAKLRLRPYILAADTGTTYAVNAFAGAWSGSTITFANTPNYYTSGSSSARPPSSTVLPLEFDVKAIVQNWANGTWVNNGFLVRDTSTLFPGYTAYRATSFYSLENYLSTDTRPQLSIEVQ